MKGKHYIDNQWLDGTGDGFTSLNPANDQILWAGRAGTQKEIEMALHAARNAFKNWSVLEFEQRLTFLSQFENAVKDVREDLIETLCQEVGKPQWEASQEIDSVIHKLPISVEAYHDRCKMMPHETKGGKSVVRHQPHGVLAVFSPFNFPAHLPNGHIIPALLAGNTVILKPSELTPLISEKIIECWEKANLPKGVINLVQGKAETGKLLSLSPHIEGLLFTGSYRTGVQISEHFGKTPEKILALEMGGNNPYIVGNIGNQINAAVYHTLQSAYVTSGQRCTCARRLIVVRGKNNQDYVDALIEAAKQIKIGPYTDIPEPFMGPVISAAAADLILKKYQALRDLGAKILLPMEKLYASKTFLSPGLIDVTEVDSLPDEEIFGPLLQLKWVDNFEQALMEANNTKYGLAAGLLSENPEHYRAFIKEIRAGIISWNRPSTGASSRAPFGGIGRSGNHRPAAYYSADYASYPVACLEETELQVPEKLTPGILLK